VNLLYIFENQLKLIFFFNFENLFLFLEKGFEIIKLKQFARGCQLCKVTRSRKQKCDKCK